mmetsp:Transcript_30730/g.98142  ORF Transcript_30730/g.98142 Transcript_30730/m.98142 type:complete len:265 (-) Transcript_30730:105-899(-)
MEEGHGGDARAHGGAVGIRTRGGGRGRGGLALAGLGQSAAGRLGRRRGRICGPAQTPRSDLGRCAAAPCPLALRHQPLLDLPLHGRVPVVLDSVVSSPRKVLGNLSPTIAVLLVGGNKLPVLLLGPGVPPDVGVEVVVPSLTALLADTAGQLLRDERPLLGAVLLDELDDLLILLLGPRALDKVGVEHLLPAVQALDVRAVREVLGDFLPVLAVEVLHGRAQDIVLLRCPPSLRRAPCRPPDLPLHRGQGGQIVRHGAGRLDLL